jgi:hypothetical protein
MLFFLSVTGKGKIWVPRNASAGIISVMCYIHTYIHIRYNICHVCVCVCVCVVVVVCVMYTIVTCLVVFCVCVCVCVVCVCCVCVCVCVCVCWGRGMRHAYHFNVCVYVCRLVFKECIMHHLCHVYLCVRVCVCVAVVVRFPRNATAGVMHVMFMCACVCARGPVFKECIMCSSMSCLFVCVYVCVVIVRFPRTQQQVSCMSCLCV